MATYFEVIKLLFFILTAIVSLYQLRLKGIIFSSIVDTIWPFVLPVYFVFLGLIIGYIIGYILNMKHDGKNEEKDYITWFIVWGFIWLLIAVLFYFSS